MATNKRRIADFLPAEIQNPELRKFFASTVDQLFQPGQADKLDGYVGQYPSYYNPSTDFYVGEGTTERTARQLEATMVSVSPVSNSAVTFSGSPLTSAALSTSASSTTITHTLFYTDLVNYLDSQGAVTLDESRLFENDYYAWAPPVDLDKLANFTQYYWFNHFADDTGNVTAQPLLNLVAPSVTYTSDGTTSSFALPAVLNGLPGSVETPQITVNDTVVQFVRSGDNLMISPPVAGAVIKTFRYGDLQTTIAGQKTFNVTGMIQAGHPAILTGYAALTSGTRVQILDALNPSPTTSQYVDGVGTSIEFRDYPAGNEALAAIYTTIGRLSRDGNGWSAHNRWVHRAAFSWASGTFQAYQAQRPIVEFYPDTQLYNYGRQHTLTVQGVLTGAATLELEWDTFEWDDERWEVGSIPLDEINGQAVGAVSDDNGHVLAVGDLILIATAVPGMSALSQIVVQVNSTIDQNGIEVIVLVPQTAPAEGDIVTVQNQNEEFWFDGAEWNKAQEFLPGVNPLFALYDVNGVVLDDPNVYPNSTFAGSALFSFATGSGNIDSILGMALDYDNNGQIIFENQLQTRTYSTPAGPISGFYFFRKWGATQSQDQFLNDWFLASTDTEQAAVNFGIYEIPPNLQANPNNQEVTLISSSEWFEHFNSIMTAQAGFTGAPYSTNNWRDTAKVLNVGAQILQHRSPLLKTMLLASDPTFDYMDACRFAEDEYTRFRSRFIQKVVEFYNNGKINPIGPTDGGPTAWVPMVLAALKANKTSNFPWSLSSAGGAQNFIPPTAASMDLLPLYEPAQITDTAYSLPVTFLQGHDGSRTPTFGESYTFSFTGTTDTVLATEPFGPVAVTVNGAALTEDEFMQAGRLVRLLTTPNVGDTVVVSVQDVRDSALLALENLIFQGTITAFGANQETYLESEPLFRLDTYWEGKFRPYTVESPMYSREEIDTILSPMFLRWTQVNQVDYQTNVSYDPADPFSWNYSDSLDRDGQSVPGHWRGIYRWYFDTDRPDTCPWEMLGFSNKPSWWDTQYGVAPYTNENTPMWTDLKNGTIRQGSRQGTDPRYARSELLSVIPVDGTGALLDPIASGIIPVPPTAYHASLPWTIGDCGPVEDLWRKSISYPYALSRAAFLMKPARWIEAGWDTLNNRIVQNGQLIYSATGDRPANSVYYVHGEIGPSGKKLSVLGVQQWISEYMVSKGQDPTTFGQAVRGLDVRLAYRGAGFLNRDNLQVMADNFGIVPTENVNVALYQSPVQRIEFYSGVIVEWTGQGWRVIGYDSTNSNFSIIPSDQNGPSVTVQLSNVSPPVIVPWKPNVSYRIGTLVAYLGSTYSCKTAHVSTAVFEDNFWTPEPEIFNTPVLNVTRYLNGLNYTVDIPYGTVFTSVQALATFLFDYERYLVAHGWVFDVQADDNTVQNWTAAVREFMNWAQVGWAPGNFIALSPGATKLKFSTDTGTIFDVTQSFRGAYNVIDRAGMPVPKKDIWVERMEGDFSIEVQNENVFGLRLTLGETEHALIFDNQTIFGDLIYSPLLNLRQPRLQLIGERSQDWAGRLDAPGYILLGNQIATNYDKTPEDIRYAFDIELADNPVLRDYARHNTGFQTRNYLQTLFLSATEQYEFYKGMIQQKGAPSIFDKLTRSTYIDQSGQLIFNEEWAFKAASYGAVAKTKRTAFNLFQQDVTRDPQIVRLTSTGTNSTDVIVETSTDFVEYTPAAATFFPQRNDYGPRYGDMPTAGYVRTQEVDYTLFHYSDLPTWYVTETQNLTVAAMTEGQRLWVYDADFAWNVFRSCNVSTDGTPNQIKSVMIPTVSNAYNAVRIFFTNPTGLSEADIGAQIIINGPTRAQPEIEGVQTITAVGADWLEIVGDGIASYIWNILPGDPTPDPSVSVADDPENAPAVLVLRPVRFTTLTALQAATNASFFPQAGELAYVDGATSWAVYETDGAGNWAPYRTQPLRMDTSQITSALIYDQATLLTSTQLNAEPLVLNEINIYDPVSGIIPGVADREISFKLEFDPALYNQGAVIDADVWGENHVGQLWWDISQVRFLEAETNDLTLATDTAEVEYRATNWGQLAPGTSVAIYEWTRSLVPPSQYSGDGTVLNASSPSWTEIQEWNASLNRVQTVYFFWVQGSTTLPVNAVVTRNVPAVTVAAMITNPTGYDIPWIAPIATDAFIVSGVQQFLDDVSSVVQIEINNLPDYDGVVHTEWTLLQTDTGQPPAALWARVVDSTVGMNYRFEQVPDPLLHPSAQQGIAVRPRQSLFCGSQYTTGQTLLAAREAMVGMINYLLDDQERPGWYTSLTGLKDTWELPITGMGNTLYWAKSTGVAISLPGAQEYDYEVGSFQAAQELVASGVSQNSVIRILVNRMQDSDPNWTVWWYTTATSSWSLGTVYDQIVSTMADRDALRLGTTPLASGTRVLVRNTGRGFWGLFSSDATQSDGWAQLRLQSYDTTDFVSRADWYAEGFSAANPPIVTYANATAFTAAETDAIDSTFVQIDDDGTGNWVWKIPDPNTSGAWITVAYQNGTVALSPSFYDGTRVRYGLDNAFDISDIPNRDGGAELRALLSVLTGGTLLSDNEISQLFFSMVSFAHSHQDQINWAFKTSFMHILGYNELLDQAPVQTPDVMSALISYIDEVKPYRVKVREFSQTYTPPSQDTANAVVRDFDRPLYWDNTISAYRNLNPTLEADIAILAANPTYTPWYTNYQKTGYDLSSYDFTTWNPVRRLTSTLYFDRIDGVTVPNALAVNQTLTLGPTTWDNTVLGAASKITQYYDPTTSMPEKNLSALLELDFKGVVIDGSTLANPATPDQYITGWDMENSNVTANSITLLLNPDVNGRPGLAINDPYWDANRPEELIAAGNYDSVVINVRGQGTPGIPMQEFKLTTVDQANVSNGIATIGYLTVPQNADAVLVFRDGLRASPDQYTVDMFARTVDVNMTHKDSTPVERVAVHVFGLGSTSNISSVDYYEYVGGQPQTFAIRNSGAVFTYVNGVATTGFTTDDASYVTVTDTLQNGDEIMIVVLESQSGAGLITITSQNFPYSGQTYTISTTSSPNSTAQDTIVELNGLRLRPSIDYAIADATLALSAGLTITSNSTITVTTFQNIDDSQIETTILQGSTDGHYTVAAPASKDYLWVTLNGRRLSSTEFNLSSTGIWFTAPQETTDVLIITAFLDSPATLPHGFLANMVLPGKSIMRPVQGGGDWDVVEWDSEPWDNGDSAVTAIIPRGPYAGQSRGLYHMDGGWEYARVSPYRDSTLAYDTLANSNVVVTSLGESQKVFPKWMFAKPQIDAPSVFWIENERVEYGDVVLQNGQYTLTSLNRGTKGTAIGRGHFRFEQYPGTGSQTVYHFDGPTSIDFLVSVYDSLGVPTALQINIDYTAALDDTGAQIVFTIPPAANTTVLFFEPLSSGVHSNGSRVTAVVETFEPSNEPL